MDDASMHATPATRLARLRARSGRSQRQLAELAGVSTDAIKSVESGRRSLTLGMARKLAPYLGIDDLADLLGSSVPMNLAGRPSHPGLPEVRQAMTTYPLTETGRPQSVAYLTGAIDAAWRTWHASRDQRTEICGVVPDLLTETRRTARLTEGTDRRTALTLMSETYHLAQAFLAWHGDPELVWLATDRGMATALDSEDPLAIAYAIAYTAHVLRAVGRSAEARANLREAIDLIEPRVNEGTEFVAAFAHLLLVDALTAARAGDPSAWSEWDMARQAVDRLLPDGYAHTRTRVGPTLVDIYAVMLDTEFGNTDEARRRAERIDPDAIPSVEWRARHYIELARGTDRTGQAEGTVHLLSKAAGTSADSVRYSPLARDMLTRLVSARSATLRADVERLATTVGLTF